MDKKISELQELENIIGSEYIVVSKAVGDNDYDNFKVKIQNTKDEPIVIDESLSEISQNPVQNKVITEKCIELEQKIEQNKEAINEIHFDFNTNQVETITLTPDKDAEVTITDLGMNTDNVKTLSFKFSIPRGYKGEKGDKGETGNVTRTLFAFKSSETRPAKPQGGFWYETINKFKYPQGWTATDELDPPIWMSNAVFDKNGIVEDWTTPIQITGENGQSGADGTNVEFIFKALEKEPEDISVIVPENNPDVNEFIPEGWSDSPQGVSKELTVEYVCSRKKDTETGKWEDFSTPALWSKFGTDGRDGDGVEYIYQLCKTATAPVTPGDVPSSNSPTEDYQQPEFIPQHAEGEEPWTDSPRGVTEEFPYEFVSIRKFNAEEQIWTLFTVPVIWAKYGKDGVDGVDGVNGVTTVSLLSIVFCRTNSIPAAPSSNEGSYLDPIPTSNVTDIYGRDLYIKWHDSIPAGEEKVWSSQRWFTIDGGTIQDSNWSEPRQMTDTATYDVEFSPNNEYPGTPDENPSLWFDPVIDYNHDFTTSVWRAERSKKNGVWSNWSVYKIKGEDGAPGTSINIKGSYDSEQALKDAQSSGAITPALGDCYVVLGELYVWDGDSFTNCGNIKGDPGVNSFVHIKYSDDGGSTFTQPDGEIPGKYIGIYVDNTSDDSTKPSAYTWTKFKGEDGFGYEYIYKRTTEFEAPSIPTTITATNTAPEGWTIDPTGVTSDIKYEWSCYRKSDENGNWGAWRGKYAGATAWLFAMYVESAPGKTGSQGPIIYPAGEYKSGTTYSKTIKDDVVIAVPYVLYNGNYYLLNTNSTTAIPTNTTDWQQFEKFDAVYASIALIDKAMVGKACFFDDYIFSQQGSGELADFDITKSPYDETQGFKPAWCVNLVTGGMWAGTGTSYFAPDGSGYLSNGEINWTSDGKLFIPQTGVLQVYYQNTLKYLDNQLNYNTEVRGTYGDNSDTQLILTNSSNDLTTVTSELSWDNQIVPVSNSGEITVQGSPRYATLLSNNRILGQVELPKVYPIEVELYTPFSQNTNKPVFVSADILDVNPAYPYWVSTHTGVAGDQFLKTYYTIEDTFFNIQLKNLDSSTVRYVTVEINAINPNTGFIDDSGNFVGTSIEVDLENYNTMLLQYRVLIIANMRDTVRITVTPN